MVLLQTLEKDSLPIRIDKTFYLSGQPANVWVVGNNEKGALWLASKNGVEKTKAEAQALVTAEVTAAQEAWDLLSDEQKATRPGENRPSRYNTPVRNL